MEQSENEHTEFKKTTGELKEGVISLASMLNKCGHGTLYFGVKNNGEISGQQIGAQTTQDISREIKNRLKPRITPEIEILDMEGKKVIRVYVEGEDAPYSAYDRYYIRSDDEDIVMTSGQLERFFTNKNYDYSQWELVETEYTADDVDETLLIDYVNKGNDCGRINFLYRDAETTLRKLNLLSGSHLNNAGYYLFSNKKPLLLKLANYPTDERIRFSDMRQFRGNIFECIEEGVKYITNNIRWKAEIVGLERVETPEIPVEAFREIVLNSFAHMRVNNTSSNEIYITPSKVHIYNPGPLVPGTDPQSFASGEMGSMIRNPLIATALYYNKTIDAFGTGFERVFKLCRNILYRYSNNQFGFTFEFFRNKNDIINDTINGIINKPLNDIINDTLNHVENQKDNVQNKSLNDTLSDTINESKNDTINDTLNKNDTITVLSTAEDRLLKLIADGKYYSKQEFSIILGKSLSTVHRYLNHLIELKLIKREGSRKTGRWVIRK